MDSLFAFSSSLGLDYSATVSGTGKVVTLDIIDKTGAVEPVVGLFKIQVSSEATLCRLA